MTEEMREHLIQIGKGCDNYEVLPKPSEMLMMGVEHYLKKIWHNADEEPKSGYPIIMLKEQEPPFSGKFYGSVFKIDNNIYWNVYNGFCCQEISPSKWCYLADLLI